MKKPRVPLVKADEYDALTRSRHLYFWQRHERRRIKNRVNRRLRRTWRDDVREQLGG